MSVNVATGSFSPVDEQWAAVKAIKAWYYDKNGPRIFKLTGPAGSGKSWLLQLLIRELNLDPDLDVCSGAYTGKASLVMRRKGVQNAKTIHQIIYRAIDKKKDTVTKMEAEIAELQQELAFEQDGDTRRDIQRKLADLDGPLQHAYRKDGITTGFKLNPESALRQAKLGLFDECSMIDNITQGDLESFGTKIIYVGDPFQLPPIVPGESIFFDAFKRPKPSDYHLKQVHRQALKSPIVAWATKVREGTGWPTEGTWRNDDDPLDMFVCVDSRRLETEHLIMADQVLVGMNKTRHAINNECRDHLGHLTASPLPRAGEKLICLKNNHPKGLFNGLSGVALRDAYDISGRNRTFRLDFVDETGVSHSGLETITARFSHPGDEDQLKADIPFKMQQKLIHMEYGYAVSVHKAQGSQYESVAIIDDGWGRYAEDRRRWAYTAITRAQKRCVYGL